MWTYITCLRVVELHLYPKTIKLKNVTTLFNCRMLSQLPKDIVPIIYKYIHNSNIDECNLEYRRKFMPKWNEKRNYFSYRDDNIFLLLNYRDIGDYGSIYSMWGDNNIADLPKNY